MRYLKLLAPALLLALLCGTPVRAYLPGNCSPGHAKSDYGKAEAVVIGRVVRIERVSEIERSNNRGETIFFGYWATIKIGRVLRGPLKTDDQIMMLLGAYAQREEDNAVPTYAATHNTHYTHDLEFNGVYLLFVKRWRPPKEWLEEGSRKIASGELVPDGRAQEILDEIRKGNVWEPRSCHYSIHQVFLEIEGSDPWKESLWVREGHRPRGPGETEKPMRLDEFLKMKRGQAEQELRTPKGSMGPGWNGTAPHKPIRVERRA